MSQVFDVHIVSLPLGAFTGATELPLAYLPAAGGGVTVLSAHLHAPGAGTAIGGKLVVMSDAGTPAIVGTIGAFAGTVVAAAGTVFAATVSTPYVPGARWIGYDQASGTLPAGAYISLAYVMGK